VELSIQAHSVDAIQERGRTDCLFKFLLVISGILLTKSGFEI
jgi:hypothetical protein